MSKSVLIDEDDDLNMKLFHDLPSADGRATLRTASGEEAIRIARERRPDLILMDVALPEASGLEVTRRLRRADDALYEARDPTAIGW